MRIPAQELETAVIGAPVERPRNQQWVVQAIGSSGIHQIRKAIEQAARMADELASGEGRIALLKGLLDRVIVQERSLTLQLRQARLSEHADEATLAVGSASEAATRKAALCTKLWGMDTITALGLLAVALIPFVRALRDAMTAHRCHATPGIAAFYEATTTLPRLSDLQEAEQTLPTFVKRREWWTE